MELKPLEAGTTCHSPAVPNMGLWGFRILSKVASFHRHPTSKRLGCSAGLVKWGSAPHSHKELLERDPARFRRAFSSAA
jgi:hypothetical protein